MPELGNITIENARIAFRNFSGKEGKYNKAGDRNFCVILEEDLAQQLAKDGWNVKTLKPREDDEEPYAQPYLQVKVGYRGRPPRTVMITSRNRTELDEGTVELLDAVSIKTVDIIIRPYEYSIPGRSGIAAYLKTMFMTVEEDELEEKYAEYPESSRSDDD